MRTHTKISILLTLCMLYESIAGNIAFADDLSDVAARVASIQATDPTLPSGVTDPKGMIGFIISKIFLSTGKIKNSFVEWISWLTSGKIPRYNGSNLVDGTIYDNGTNIGIGTTSPGTSKLNVQQTGANIAITAQTVGAQWVYAVSSTHYGVHGVSTSSMWVIGQSTNGQWVYGSSTSHYGVQGFSTSSIGVVGQSSTVQWVYGQSASSMWVQGDSTSSYGVYGTSGTNLWVYGYSTSNYGVYGQSPGTYWVVGRTTNATYGWVLGYNNDATVYGILWVGTNSLSGNGNITWLRHKFNWVGGDSGAAQDNYAIYQEAGAWTSPYPDLLINYHTGIKMGAYSGYGWIRFFNNAIGAGGESELMSIGNGDNFVRVAYRLYSPISYDTDNTAYYIDANNTSVMQALNVSSIADRDNTAFYVDPNGNSNTNNFYRANGYNGAEYDANNAAYYLDPSSTSITNDFRANIFYDNNDTAYYVNPNGFTSLYEVKTARKGLYGTYNAAEVQWVWSIANGYEIDTTGNNFGTQYGMVYAHTNAGTAAMWGKLPITGQGHQILFTTAGTTTAMISLSTGNAQFAGSVKTTCVWNCF